MSNYKRLAIRKNLSGPKIIVFSSNFPHRFDEQWFLKIPINMKTIEQIWTVNLLTLNMILKNAVSGRDLTGRILGTG